MAKPIVSAERLRELLTYDPEAGLFIWRVNRRGPVKAGDIAGHLSKSDGYIYMKIDGRRYSAHRLAWLHATSNWPIAEIDHIDRDRTNYKLSNLREATSAQNKQNAGPRSDKRYSTFTGVSWYKPTMRWRAYIMLNGRYIHLGCFDTEEAAHLAHISAKRRLHPFDPRN